MSIRHKVITTKNRREPLWFHEFDVVSNFMDFSREIRVVKSQILSTKPPWFHDFFVLSNFMDFLS